MEELGQQGFTIFKFIMVFSREKVHTVQLYKGNWLGDWGSLGAK